MGPRANGSADGQAVGPSPTNNSHTNTREATDHTHNATTQNKRLLLFHWKRKKTMGRVARFKKIRACDPYSRENRGRIAFDRVGVWGLSDSGRKPKKRSLVAQKMQAVKRKRRKGQSGVDEGFDLPPNEEDEFDSTTFVVQKKTKPLSMDDVEAEAKKQTPREAEKEEKRINKLLKIDAQIETKTKNVSVPEKMPGETKGAYRKRVHTETRQLLKESNKSKLSGKKKEKQKEFFKNKKLKKKGLAAPVHNYKDGDDFSLDDTTTPRVVDNPIFGEVAERPPEFRALPRGAAKKDPGSSKSAAPAKKRKAMDSKDVDKEQQTMEMMRRKVQAQYALVRQKRRGEFHL